MSLQSRLRPDSRYPDIGRGQPVRHHPLLRETDLPANYERDYGRAWRALAKQEGHKRRHPGRGTSPRPPKDELAARRVAVSVMLDKGMNAPAIAKAMNATESAIRHDIYKIQQAG